MRAAEDNTISIPPVPEAASRVVVELTGIRKCFGATRCSRASTCGVHSGEHVVVFGPSGSGKSTLLRTINLLEPPTSGSVQVDGTEYAQGGPAIELRRAVGMVFQQFNLFPHLTALDNIALSLRRAKRRQARRAKERAATSCGGSACSPTPRTSRTSCPAASSSASRSPGRSRWTPR